MSHIHVYSISYTNFHAGKDHREHFLPPLAIAADDPPLEDAFVNGRRTITTADIQSIRGKTKYISDTLKEKIKELEENSNKFDMEEAN